MGITGCNAICILLCTRECPYCVPLPIPLRQTCFSLWFSLAFLSFLVGLTFSTLDIRLPSVSGKQTPLRQAGLNGEEKGTLSNFLFLIFFEQVAKFLKEEVRPALIPYQSKMGGKIELAL